MTPVVPPLLRHPSELLRPVARACLWIALLHLVFPLHAVIFFKTDDPAYNTQKPTGELAGSGWDFQGLWGSYLGTVIASHYFITAKHVGGNIGDAFVFDGIAYTTMAMYDDTLSDLRICRVRDAFPRFAAILTNANEVGRHGVVIGRGTQRGARLETVSTNFFGQVVTREHGWLWGISDGVVRWGENDIETVVQARDSSSLANTVGDLLRCNFNSGGGSNECHLSTGDSGGALFVRDGEAWSLAGIHYAADGVYRLTDAGMDMAAAVYDKGGLYQQDGDRWIFAPPFPFPQPGFFYSTRISTRAEWIRSILQQTTPADPVALQSAAAVDGLFEDSLVQPDYPSGTIRIPVPAASRFFRIRSDVTPRRITSFQVEGDQLVLKFDAGETGTR